MRKNNFVSIVCVMFFVVGCNQFNDRKILKYSGTVELTEHAIGARVAGRIAAINFNEGSRVLKGQWLAQMDRYDQTRKDYIRLIEMQKVGGVSQQDLEHAFLAMDDCQIISPVEGDVLVKVKEVGEIVSAGAPIVVVGDRSDIWVKVFIPEGEINHIKVGQGAVIHLDGIRQGFRGKVSFVAPRAEFTPRNVQTAEERITQVFSVKIRFDNPEEFIRPGVAADVTIEQ